MADDEDDWAVQPPPMTAVAVRIEQEAVDLARPLAAEQSTTVAELFRRWVLERLIDELEPEPEPEPEPTPPAPTPAAEKPAAKKKAARTRSAAKKEPAARKAGTGRKPA